MVNKNERENTIRYQRIFLKFKIVTGEEDHPGLELRYDRSEEAI